MIETLKEEDRDSILSATIPSPQLIETPSPFADLESGYASDGDSEYSESQPSSMNTKSKTIKKAAKNVEWLKNFPGLMRDRCHRTLLVLMITLGMLPKEINKKNFKTDAEIKNLQYARDFLEELEEDQKRSLINFTRYFQKNKQKDCIKSKKTWSALKALCQQQDGGMIFHRFMWSFLSDGAKNDFSSWICNKKKSCQSNMTKRSLSEIREKFQKETFKPLDL